MEKTVWPLFKVGKIRSVVSETFPLERTLEAHAMMESGHHTGKIVLLTEYADNDLSAN